MKNLSMLYYIAKRQHRGRMTKIPARGTWLSQQLKHGSQRSYEMNDQSHSMMCNLIT
jgi:hypothetical protein